MSGRQEAGTPRFCVATQIFESALEHHRVRDRVVCCSIGAVRSLWLMRPDSQCPMVSAHLRCNHDAGSRSGIGNQPEPSAQVGDSV